MINYGSKIEEKDVEGNSNELEFKTRALQRSREYFPQTLSKKLKLHRHPHVLSGDGRQIQRSQKLEKRIFFNIKIYLSTKFSLRESE